MEHKRNEQRCVEHADYHVALTEEGVKYVCKFDELLHGEVKNEYILSLKKCELIRDTRSATFFFAVSQIPDEKEKARILGALRKLVPKCVERISASYTRIYFDDEVLRAFLKNFLSKNAASLLCGVDFERVALKEQTLKIPVDENILQFLGDGKLASTLENALSAEYYAYFKVQFSAAEVFRPIEEEEVIVAPVSKRAISVANRAKLVGSEVEGDASYLSDVSAEGTEVVLCGKIKFFTERVRTKKDGSQGAYFTFELEDFTGKIRCVYSFRQRFGKIPSAQGWGRGDLFRRRQARQPRKRFQLYGAFALALRTSQRFCARGAALKACRVQVSGHLSRALFSGESGRSLRGR